MGSFDLGYKQISLAFCLPLKPFPASDSIENPAIGIPGFEKTE